jgi:hypothetical protein
MKKLMLAALAMGIALGSVSFAAQQPDTSADSGKTKTSKKHKKSKKSSDTTKNKM